MPDKLKSLNLELQKTNQEINKLTHQQDTALHEEKVKFNKLIHQINDKLKQDKIDATLEYDRTLQKARTESTDEKTEINDKYGKPLVDLQSTTKRLTKDIQNETTRIAEEAKKKKIAATNS